MLLCNTHIEVAIRILLFEFNHAGTFAHGRCNAYQTTVFGGHIAQPLTEHLGVGRAIGFGALQWHTGGWIKGCDCMQGKWVLFGEFVAMTLARHNVQEHGAALFSQVAQHCDQTLYIVPVHGPVIIEAQFFEQ